VVENESRTTISFFDTSTTTKNQWDFSFDREKYLFIYKKLDYQNVRIK